jgi:hypothetical protein
MKLHHSILAGAALAVQESDRKTYFYGIFLFIGKPTVRGLT